MKWVLLLLLLASCVAQPYVQPGMNKTEVVEKVFVQCWDGSTAESVEKCPPQEKAAEPEVVKPEVVSKPEVAEPAVPIGRKLLEEAKTKFKSYAYLLDDRMVIVYGNKIRHLFLKLSLTEDRTPITDVFVDLDKNEAVAYCHIEREGRDILGDSFDLERSQCKNYIDKPVSVKFEKWVPKGPLDYLEEFADLEPILVENNIQTISISGNSKTIQPSLHYMVNGKRVILRIDRRYQVPIKIEVEGQQAVDFRETYFDVMVLYEKQQKIDQSWVEYVPVSDYWKAAATK